MNILRLLQDALAERGNAIVVIARPQNVEAAVICYANSTFSDIIGHSAESMIGSTIDSLLYHLTSDADWTLISQALRDRVPLSLDIKLAVSDHFTWFGFGLTFKTDPNDGVSYAIIVGRDITKARSISTQDDGTRRLLAGVFQRIEAPVAIVGANGALMMTNLAFQKLFGYQASELNLLYIEGLVAEDFSQVANIARTQQLLDGRSYQIRLGMVAKDGTRRHVTVTSVLLVEADQRVRVITLNPDTDLDVGEERLLVEAPDAFSQYGRNVGQMEVITLSAFKVLLGGAWAKISLRAMLTAEQIISRRLGKDDVSSRCGDHEFIIWFDGANADRNAAVLAGIVRDIRLRFVADFGETIAPHINAVVVPTSAGRDAVSAMTASKIPTAPAGHFQQAQQDLAVKAPLLLRPRSIDRR